MPKRRVSPSIALGFPSEVHALRARNALERALARARETKIAAGQYRCAEAYSVLNAMNEWGGRALTEAAASERSLPNLVQDTSRAMIGARKSFWRYCARKG